MNRDQCKEFKRNPTVNPLTNRKIKINGPTYQLLMNQCQKVCFIFVYGLGCHTNLPNLAEWQTYYTNISRSEVNVFCDGKVGSILFDSVKQVCFIPPSIKNSFVARVYEKILESVKSHDKVYIGGHSYGGAVVSTIAKHCDRHMDHNVLNKLEFNTFGSIYIPKDVTNANIKHYMYTNDVALKCNKLQVKEKVKNVKWLNVGDKTPVRKFSLFGTKKEWDIHNQYKEYIKEFFLNGKS